MLARRDRIIDVLCVWFSYVPITRLMPPSLPASEIVFVPVPVLVCILLVCSFVFPVSGAINFSLSLCVTFILLYL
jgi:hypothetical protein